MYKLKLFIQRIINVKDVLNHLKLFWEVNPRFLVSFGNEASWLRQWLQISFRDHLSCLISDRNPSNKMNSRKRCFVPKCMNTSKSNSNKIFISVPTNITLRKKWFAAVHRNMSEVSPKTSFHCCEDHFNVSQNCCNKINQIYRKMFVFSLKMTWTIISSTN